MAELRVDACSGKVGQDERMILLQGAAVAEAERVAVGVQFEPSGRPLLQGRFGPEGEQHEVQVQQRLVRRLLGMSQELDGYLFFQSGQLPLVDQVHAGSCEHDEGCDCVVRPEPLRGADLVVVLDETAKFFLVFPVGVS